MEKKKLGFSLKRLFSSGIWDDDFFEELEDLLITGDLGAGTAMEISDLLRGRVRQEKPKDKDAVMAILKSLLEERVKVLDLQADPSRMNVFLVLGVNGVGKTTTIAKLAQYYARREGIRPVLSAGDTFRAAAIDQLEIHGQRLGIRVVRQEPGSDPGAVIYDTLVSAASRGENLVLADTAGRMHNKENLVRELQKIHKIVSSKAAEANYKKLLVIDATTGQNGLRQAETFHQAVGVDGIILAKFDSAAKGGIAVAISRELGIPFCFLGTGENYEAIRPFDREDYLNSLLELSPS